MKTVQIRQARKVDIYLAAGFDKGRVSCPICKEWLDYRQRTGRAWCRHCERSWKSLDYVMELHGLTLEQAADVLLGGASNGD